jgi:hypothetical protein
MNVVNLTPREYRSYQAALELLRRASGADLESTLLCWMLAVETRLSELGANQSLTLAQLLGPVPPEYSTQDVLVVLAHMAVFAVDARRQARDAKIIDLDAHRKGTRT